MKNILFTASVIAVALLSGCKNEKSTSDYVKTYHLEAYKATEKQIPLSEIAESITFVYTNENNTIWRKSHHQRRRQ